jgi:uncharacterized protein YfaS (alpha-2-macroglobulin family)
VTYPNVLVLDYLKRTGKAKPEVRMKAERYVNLGYQRLLTFRSDDGGFNLWGRGDASQTFLTAYALMQFSDMSKVRLVDPKIISGAQEWLSRKQNADGSWTEVGGLFEGWHSQPRAAVPFTAWVVWALEESSDIKSQIPNPKSQIERGIEFLRQRVGSESEPYNLALCANAFAAAGHAEDAKQILARLDSVKMVKGKTVYWKCGAQTFTYGWGNVADIETTALATYALIRSGAKGDTATKALGYLIEQKDQRGAWHSTQATILSLKALIAALGNATERGAATIEITVNDHRAQTLHITEDQSDVVQMVDLRDFVRAGQNTVTLKASGAGKPMFQIVGKYWVREGEGEGRKGKEVEIDMAYDRSTLKQNDTVRASVTLRYNRTTPTYMVIADLGVAPGFTPLTEDLDALVAEKIIQRYETTGRQIIVYLDKVTPGKAVRFSYRLKAKFPVRAKVPASRAYDYYNPNVQGRVRATEVVVRA